MSKESLQLADAASAEDEFLTPKQVADEFPFSVAQLNAWRLMEVGPPFIKGPGKWGRVLYRRSGVESWLDERTVHPSGDAA